MSWVSLNCPQCSAPLPRVAIWRAVKCGSCGALITRTESVVSRDSFRQALGRSRAQSTCGDVQCCGESYHLVQSLGQGEISDVYLARRCGPLPLLATVKISSSPAAHELYSREAGILRDLHESFSGADAGYLSAFLPVVIGQGLVEGDGGRQVLILHHPNGYWGSLTALHRRFPHGIDPRHAVWIWRRVLSILHAVHLQGWSHGDVCPDHALVHPGDHGVRLISWASATKGASAQQKAADLARAASVVRVLLCGAGESMPAAVPQGFADLLRNTWGDVAFCLKHGADGLDQLLQSEARKAFGPPSFVPLIL
jgi:serine/threonine protein kinase